MAVARKESTNFLAWFGALCVLVIFVWASFPFWSKILFSRFQLSTLEDFARYGDTYGSLNALFTAFAFCALVITVLMQRQELMLQREELRLTRSELEGQRHALESQNATLERQNIDNRLFQMLQFHHQITSAIDIKSNEGVEMSRGHDAFRFFHRVMTKAFEITQAHFPPSFGLNADQATAVAKHFAAQRYPQLRRDRRVDFDDTAIAAYLVVYDQYQGDLAHYFRNLYHLIRLIDESRLTDRDKRQFTNLVRAQLSSYELVMLFYNGIAPYGYEKLHPLIEKYGLFKAVEGTLLLSQAHRPYYATAAYFGSPDKFADEYAPAKVGPDKDD